VYEIGDVLLLVMPRTMTSSVLTKLDQLVFSEDVKLGDVSDTFRSVAVVGPRAADAVASVVSVSSETLKGLPAHGNVRVEMNGRPAVVLQIDDIGERGYEALVEPGDDTRLIDGLHRYGVVDIDDAAAEALRIEAGIPKFGRDMDHDTIPLEAGIQDRAISLNKGCYVGQEVIIRVLHRGHGRVARKLVGLVAFGGAGVFPGARIFADGRDVGEITSASHSPRLDRRIALGYVHRDSASPGASLTIGSVTAVVSALPFATKGGE
jgi:folate-binding protein YgfZ